MLILLRLREQIKDEYLQNLNYFKLLLIIS